MYSPEGEKATLTKAIEALIGLLDMSGMNDLYKANLIPTLALLEKRLIRVEERIQEEKDFMEKARQ